MSLAPYSEIVQLATLIADHILRQGMRPELSLETIVKDIQRIFVQRFNGKHINDIQYHQHPVVCPIDWTDYHERIWRDWIEMTFTYEAWITEVLYPLFGTDTAPWEYSIPGWREDLHQFLWTWIRRNEQVVTDAEPFPEIEEEMEEHVKINIDPYILEHGSAKQKRAAYKQYYQDAVQVDTE
jgi:hypothetical protein